LIGVALAFAAAAVTKIYEDLGTAIEAISQFDFGQWKLRLERVPFSAGKQTPVA
jgi:hypothetical protein